MSFLKVDNIEVVYQHAITAIQGVSLDVHKSQITALLGTNGAGKTTTPRAISGFLGLDDARVTEGSITFQGQSLENRAPYAKKLYDKIANNTGFELYELKRN